MQSKNNAKGKAENIDIHVGKNIKAIRINQGLTQESVAGSLGISFQQLQKYENGKNRISASKLYFLSKILKTDLSGLFTGINDNFCTDNACSIEILDKETIKIIKSIKNIKDQKIKKSLLDILELYSNKSN